MLFIEYKKIDEPIAYSPVEHDCIDYRAFNEYFNGDNLKRNYERYCDTPASLAQNKEYL
jgi:hypothetical protein